MYKIQDREAGNLIDTFSTIESAKKALAEYEAGDKEDGTYQDDFYEIVDENGMDEIRSEVRSEVRSKVINEVCSEVRSKLINEVCREVSNEIDVL